MNLYDVQLCKNNCGKKVFNRDRLCRDCKPKCACGKTIMKLGKTKCAKCLWNIKRMKREPSLFGEAVV